MVCCESQQRAHLNCCPCVWVVSTRPQIGTWLGDVSAHFALSSEFRTTPPLLLAQLLKAPLLFTHVAWEAPLWEVWEPVLMATGGFRVVFPIPRSHFPVWQGLTTPFFFQCLLPPPPTLSLCERPISTLGCDSNSWESLHPKFPISVIYNCLKSHLKR